MTQRLMVAADVMFVSKVDFLVSVSHSLKFTMEKYVQFHTSPVIYKHLEEVYDIYIRRGFTVELFLMDTRFKCLYNNMPGSSEPNNNGAKEHVADIKGQV